MSIAGIERHQPNSHDSLTFSPNVTSCFYIYNPLPTRLEQLPNQRIGPEGAAALCAGLAENNASVTYLDLRANGIMDAGACSVAELLRTDRKLKTINLEANRIADDGAKVRA